MHAKTFILHYEDEAKVIVRCSLTDQLNIHFEEYAGTAFPNYIPFITRLFILKYLQTRVGPQLLVEYDGLCTEEAIYEALAKLLENYASRLIQDGFKGCLVSDKSEINQLLQQLP